MTEATLACAQAGDGEAFRELIDPYRRELQAHCYRILGSAEDAAERLTRCSRSSALESRCLARPPADW